MKRFLVILAVFALSIVVVSNLLDRSNYIELD